MYNLLFSSAWHTIRDFAHDRKYLGANPGMIAVLHTWGQNLSLHPHIHCLVPGGGITPGNKWRSTRSKGKYLFPVKALAKTFRGKFTDGLIALHQKADIPLEVPFDKQKKYQHPLYRKKWVVNARLPLHNAEQVVNYIGRYSHRIAISNHRIKDVNNDTVKFSWFNYRTSKAGILELEAAEFLRRFSLHILPDGFMKIRHFGILSARSKKTSLSCVRKFLDVNSKSNPPEKSYLSWIQQSQKFTITCPVCKKGLMRLVDVVLPFSRGSPLKTNVHNFYKV
jgi:hypothetical protein